MCEEDELESLTQRLQKIRVEKEKIYKKEAALVRRIQEIRTSRTQSQKEEQAATTPNPSRVSLSSGDHVVITNRIGHISTRQITERDRVGIVTEVVNDRVYIRTAAEHPTWRKRHNLRRISSRKYQQIKEHVNA